VPPPPGTGAGTPVPPPPGSTEVGAGGKLVGVVLVVDVDDDDDDDDGVDDAVPFTGWLAETEELPPADPVGAGTLERGIGTPMVTVICVRTPFVNRIDGTYVNEVDTDGLLPLADGAPLLPPELLLA